MKRPFALGIVLLGTAAVVLSASRGETRAIDVERLRRHVGYLASDALGGRETGEPGVRKAERYVARRFEQAGLDPLPGREAHWIDFTLYRRGYVEEATSIVIEAGAESRREGRLGSDFRPFAFSDTGEVRAPLVFVGYGITAPEHGYDDYAGLDVEGKIVLMLRHEPGERDPASSFDGTSDSRHALFATKAANARAHGAAGMLLVTDPLHHGPDDDLRAGGSLSLEPGTGSSDDGSRPPLLAVHLSQETAAAIVAAAGHSLEQMQQAVDSGTLPDVFRLGDVTAQLAIERTPEDEIVRARNVAAFLEGRDPALKHEWIVIGAHHDHLGAFDGQGDTIYNGADDNASGTAGVIELARAFAERAERPRRSLAFVTFSAEEKGLLGSRAMVEQGLIPTERVVYMLNLDMIGRDTGEPVRLYGDGYVRGLRRVAEQASAGLGLEVDYAGADYSGNSDHDPFYARAIPFTFLFTGVHDDYHRRGDHPDKLDYERMQSIVRMAYGIVEQLAEADEAPGFVHHVAWLGARVEVLAEDGARRAVVAGVDEGSRAQLAGLRTGDLVVALDGVAVDEPDAVGSGLIDVEPASDVTLVLRRGDESLALTLERARTGYLGVAPGAVDAERRRELGLPAGEGFVLRRVLEDGPSDRAGLREGDIVVRFAGRSVGSSNLASTLMQVGAGETVHVTLIRDGERRTLPVTLAERPEGR